MSGLPRSHDRGTVRRLTAFLGVLLIVSGLLPVVGVQTVLAGSTAFLAPDNATTPNDWTSGANATDNSDDEVFATATGDNVDQGYRDFGFSLPQGSIVDGITVNANAFSSDSSGCQLSARLSWNGGSNYSSRITANLNDDPAAVVVLGNSSDAWGHVWDPGELSDTAFRLQIRNEDPGSGCSGTTSLDWVTARVTYRTIDGGTSNPKPSGDICEAADFNFVIDMSGSIGAQGGTPSNLPDLITGINGFVAGFQNAGGDGLYSGTRFNGSSTAALTSGYKSAAMFSSVVGGLSNPNGLTPTAAGITAAAGNNANDRAGVPNVMFVVTDGSPNKPNSHGDDLANPDTWLTAANAAVAAADAARAGSGANGYIVKAVYLSTAGDPGDTSLPFSSTGDSKWAQKVMDEIGGGTHLAADFTGFIDDLFTAIGCPPPSVEITKVADDTTVDAGDQIGFTVKVTNAGGKAAHDVAVSDNLPDTSGTDWSISPAVSGCSITGSPGNQALHCDFGTLNAGAHKSVHVASGTGSACGKYENTATFTSSEGQAGEASASVNVRCAHIDITKVADAASVSAGDDIGFTITVKSTGPGAAKGVVMTDVLPTDPGTSWTIDGGTGAGTCSTDAGTITCAFGDMANGASYTVHLSSPTTKATIATSPVSNTADVTTTNDGSDSDTDQVVVLAGSIDITKVADAASVSAGDDIGFTITVKSTGPGAAKGVVMTDVLPTDPGTSWTIDGGTGAGTCSTDAGTITCAFGDMANGASYTVHLSSPTTKATIATSPVSNTADVTTTNDGSDSDTDQVVVLAGSIDITKVADAASVSAGDDIGFTITVKSTGPGAAKGVVMTDVLPTDPGTSWTIDGGTGAGTCSTDAGTITCAFGDMANGASYTVHLSSPTTKATIATSPVSNTADVTTTNDGSDSDTDQVVVLAGSIDITKVADAASVSAGDDIGFTITVKSTGPGAAKGVVMTDVLPTDPGTSWTIDGGTGAGTCSTDAGTITCAFGDMANGASYTVHLSSPTTKATIATSPVSNTADVTTTNDGSDSDTDQVVVLGPDIHVQKSGNGPISAGDVAVFTIIVSNDGAGAATDVVLTDSLPDGVDWSTKSAGCSIAPDSGTIDQVLTCDLGSLASGGTRTIIVSGETTAADCPSLANSASATSSNEAARETGDNVGSGTIEVDCAEITVTKTADAASVSAGDAIGFTITVTNTGSGTAYGVQVQDLLPTNPGLGWTIDPADNAWTIDGGVLRFGPATLLKGDSVDVHITSGTTSATCPQAVDNTVTVTTTNDGSDEDLSSITILCPDVTISKTADNGSILAGQDARFTISVWNDGSGTARDVAIRDTLPAGFAWTVDAEDCSITDGVLDCLVGDLDPDSMFTVHLSAPTLVEDCGSLTNVASVDAANEADAAMRNNTDSDDIDVLCAGIDLVKTAGDVPDGETMLLVAPGDVAFTYVVRNTGTATLINVELVDDNATPDDPTDDVTVACPQSTLAPDEEMTCTVTLPVTGYGLMTNIAVVTGTPEIEPQQSVSDVDDATVSVPEPEVTPTPRITPPPTSTIDAVQGPATGSSLPVLLVILGVVMLVAGYAAPATAKARRSRR